jgi:hypothetical protein
MTVMETISSSIETMTSRTEELKAELVTLGANISEHYEFLGRRYYDERHAARVAATNS